MNPYRMSVANLPAMPDIPPPVPPLPSRPVSSLTNNQRSRLDLPLRAYSDKSASSRNQSPHRSESGLVSIPDEDAEDDPANSSPSVTAYTPTSSQTPTSDTANTNGTVARSPQQHDHTLQLLSLQDHQTSFDHTVVQHSPSQETPRAALLPSGPLSAEMESTTSGLSGGLMTVLPKEAGFIRIIAEGTTKVITVKDCQTVGEAMQKILKKFFLGEEKYPNFTIWLLMSLDRLYHNSRRLGDTELWDIMMDGDRPERNRLILRRVKSGEPTEVELHTSAALMVSEEKLGRKLIDGSMDTKNVNKITQLLGPGWEKTVEGDDVPAHSFSSTFTKEHTFMMQDLGRMYPANPPTINLKTGVSQFGPLRPVSEYITQEIGAFFPDLDADQINKTARMSMRRSARLSRLNNRLSVASVFSLASSGAGGNEAEEAPPIPAIADSWFREGDRRASVRPEAAATSSRTSEEMDAEYDRRRTSRAPRIPTIYGTQSFAAAVFGTSSAFTGSDTNGETNGETDDNETPMRAHFEANSGYTTENAAEQTDQRQSYIEDDTDATEVESPGQWVTTPRRSAAHSDNNPYATPTSTLVGDGNEVPRSQSSYGLDLESGNVAPNRRRLTLVLNRRPKEDGGQDADDEADADGQRDGDDDEDDEGVLRRHTEHPDDIRDALIADGQGVDPELVGFLAGDAWGENMWLKGALIGKGSFGTVYLALHTITGELMAVKQVESPRTQMDAEAGEKRSVANAVRREIAFLRDLTHPNIVSYLGCGNSPDHMNIFLEYVPGGSVQMMLKSYGALPEPLIKSFVRQILQGLEFLHSLNIIHRDIKGGNILVNDEGHVKISDFGISKKMETTDFLAGVAAARRRPSMQGSVFWMAPEVVKQTTYGFKADIWSVGCLMVEMMTGSHPYPDCSQLQAIFKIGAGRIFPAIPEYASQDSRELLFQTFEVNQEFRPTAAELLLSPFQTDREREDLAIELVALRLEIAEKKMIQMEAEQEAKRIREAQEAEELALAEAARVAREARASLVDARDPTSAEGAGPAIEGPAEDGAAAPVAELMGPDAMELQAVAHEEGFEGEEMVVGEVHADQDNTRLERLGLSPNARQTDFGIEGDLDGRRLEMV